MIIKVTEPVQDDYGFTNFRECNSNFCSAATSQPRKRPCGNYQLSATHVNVQIVEAS